MPGIKGIEKYRRNGEYLLGLGAGPNDSLTPAELAVAKSAAMGALQTWGQIWREESLRSCVVRAIRPAGCFVGGGEDPRRSRWEAAWRAALKAVEGSRRYALGASQIASKRRSPAPTCSKGEAETASEGQEGA